MHFCPVQGLFSYSGLCVSSSCFVHVKDGSRDNPTGSAYAPSTRTSTHSLHLQAHPCSVRHWSNVDAGGYTHKQRIILATKVSYWYKSQRKQWALVGAFDILCCNAKSYRKKGDLNWKLSFQGYQNGVFCQSNFSPTLLFLSSKPWQTHPVLQTAGLELHISAEHNSSRIPPTSSVSKLFL